MTTSCFSPSPWSKRSGFLYSAFAFCNQSHRRHARDGSSEYNGSPSSALMADMVASMLNEFKDYQRSSYAFDYFIMSPHNPIRMSYQYLLAIMGSSRHDCRYLIQRFEERLLQLDDSAVHGFTRLILAGALNEDSKSMPRSFKGLFHLNKLLAHRPWVVDGGTIRKVVWFDRNNPMSVGELMQALFILVNFHALSGFIYGCGLEGSGCEFLGHCTLSNYPSLQSLFKSNAKGCSTAEGLEGDQQSDLTPDEGPLQRCLLRGQSSEAWKQRATSYDKATQTSEFEETPSNRKRQTAGNDMETINRNASCFRYRPMKVREKLSNHLSLNVEQFNWDFCGMEVAEMLFPDSCGFVDAKFKSAMAAYPVDDSKSPSGASSATSSSLDSSDSQDSVDDVSGWRWQSVGDRYRHSRLSIWEYVQEQYGMVHSRSSRCFPRKKSRRRSGWRNGGLNAPSRLDQNTFAFLNDEYTDTHCPTNDDMLSDGRLNKAIRSYIRIIATCPETVTRSDFEKVLKYIPPSLLIMINIVIREARFQCELLYALRAVHQYMQTASLPLSYINEDSIIRPFEKQGC